MKLSARMFALVICIAAALIGGKIPRAKADNCTGTPSDAVTTLPQPLAKWGALVCTPYGHIISNRAGWIWTNPGSYSPVFIPSQIVQRDPAPIGNKSYFTKIKMTKVDGSEFQTAYAAYHENFAPDAKLPDGYRLDLVSVSGRTLKFYFFDYGTSAWGIWCTAGNCDPKSQFMILDMARKPK